MSENKIEKFLKLRYFLTVFIVTLHLSFGIWTLAKNSNVSPNFFSILFISAILRLINNRWLYRALILLNIFDFVSLLSYVIGRCQENFPVNTLRDSYYWLIDMSIFRWNVAFWVLQISLIVYLITVEIEVYKEKNSLV
ncbi:hypothetical protein BH18ACI1_BH18ACI1_12430 [soil metagenome]